MDGWIDGWMDGRIKRTAGRTDGQTNGRMDGWMDGVAHQSVHDDAQCKAYVTGRTCADGKALPPLPPPPAVSNADVIPRMVLVFPVPGGPCMAEGVCQVGSIERGAKGKGLAWMPGVVLIFTVLLP
eukprot:329514-Chlamydomonas_euryale.AAC.2